MPAPTRLALVSRHGELDTCLPGFSSAGLEIARVERPPEADPERLLTSVKRLGPGLVLVLDPEPGDGELLGAIDGARSVAWLASGRPPAAGDGAALAGFDRVLATGETSARRAAGRELAAIEPLPVGDAYFREPRDFAARPRVFFDGPTSARRDTLLQPLKHHFEVLHVAGGADPERLGELMGRCDVALDLNDERGVTTRDRVGPALAAGLLVLAERPAERPGLHEGVQLAGFGALWDAHELLASIRRHPDALRSIRIRGRLAAEQLRASVAFPRLLAALLPAR